MRSGVRFLAFSLLCGSALCSSTQAQMSVTNHGNLLMPEPASMVAGTGDLPITPAFTTALAGADSPRLERAVARTLQQLEDKTGLPLPKHIGHGSSATLVIDIQTDGPVVQGPDDDESYRLTSTATGLRIEAPNALGAMHGLQTLLQLVQPGTGAYTIPSVTIDDKPRFRWRGLMIDCSRHFEPIEVLKRNLDAMAAVKLNVFHWHMVDDQGFRIESKRFPRLTGLGSDGLFYTQDQARDLVRYAADRGIRVVPEFEMPGHSTAWLVAYPELASGSRPTAIRREFGVSDYVLDPTREQTYRFLEEFLAEMATIFPDQYVHIGGDEAPAPDWKTNPRIVAFKQAHHLADNDALQAYFNQQVLAILTHLHRRMVGWDEIFNPALPRDVVIQSWRGEASLAKGAQQGYQGVLSAPYYLDGMRSAAVHYLADPVPADTLLTPQQQQLILGGEVCMWAEHLDQRTIDSRIWPRAAAVAERFWSPQNVRDVDDMYRRLQGVSVELEALGLQHLSSEDRGLRELAGTEAIDSLRTFAAAFEPVPFGERVQGQHTSQLTPLTSFVDAVRPDPPIRHALELATRTYLADPGLDKPDAQQAFDLLQRFYADTAHSVAPVQQLMPSAPRLQPIATRAQQLSSLMTIAQQALAYTHAHTPAPQGWKQTSLAAIEAAKKPSGLVRFDFLAPLTDLVNATP